jgi:hypothetical protein
MSPERSDEDGSDGREEPSDLYSDLSVYMQKVITDSFCSQITENKAAGRCHSTAAANPNPGDLSMNTKRLMNIFLHPHKP